MTPEENEREAQRLRETPCPHWDVSPEDQMIGPKEWCNLCIAQALAAREAATVERCAEKLDRLWIECDACGERTDCEPAADALRATLKPEAKGEGR